jgi:anti-sigma factor RsiW
MKHSPLISDELLSAYLDQQISEAELRRVEKALAAEPAMQYQLETLQTTVALMRSAPALVVPRALTLSENQVLAAGGRVRGVKQPSFWDRWLPRMMPAATAVVAILFIFSLTFSFPLAEKQAAAPIQMASAPAEIESAPAMAREAAAEAGPEMQTLSVEQPAPRAAQPRAAVTEDESPAKDETANAQTLTMTGADQSEEVTGQTTPSSASASPERLISRGTWLLGLLLILLLFLTWRVTIVRSRRR